MVLKITCVGKKCRFLLLGLKSQKWYYDFLAKFKLLKILAYVLLCLLKGGYFGVQPCLWRHCDVILKIFVLILIWKEETDRYNMVQIRRIPMGSVFKFTRVGNHPVGNPYHRKKAWYKTRVYVYRIKILNTALTKYNLMASPGSFGSSFSWCNIRCA